MILYHFVKGTVSLKCDHASNVIGVRECVSYWNLLAKIHVPDSINMIGIFRYSSPHLPYQIIALLRFCSRSFSLEFEFHRLQNILDKERKFKWKKYQHAKNISIWKKITKKSDRKLAKSKLIRKGRTKQRNSWNQIPSICSTNMICRYHIVHTNDWTISFWILIWFRTYCASHEYCAFFAFQNRQIRRLNIILKCTNGICSRIPGECAIKSMEK